ncbi:MAG TPA: hypothetical protein VMB71_16580, partial [Acetobacteraceae bacterium]|nr:hypothetical protein [Acetobacteraceae bacterium]
MEPAPMSLAKILAPMAAAAAALAAVPAAAQTYSTFDPIQFPGAGSTLPLAINDMGQIVGEVTSGAAQPPLILNGQDFWTTGFELDAGLYSLLYYPAAQITGANPGWPAG